MICARCGKPLEGEGMLFCPYCGEKLAAREAASPEAPNAEAQQWIQKALAVSSYPERKKILQQGLAACPGDREIEWEMLFVGEPQKRRKRGRIIAWCIVMGNWFGFQIGSNRDKKLATPVAQMIVRIRTDEKLSPERREQLWKTLYQAYAAKADGKTGYLDQCLTKDA